MRARRSHQSVGSLAGTAEARPGHDSACRQARFPASEFQRPAQPVLCRKAALAGSDSRCATYVEEVGPVIAVFLVGAEPLGVVGGSMLGGADRASRRRGIDAATASLTIGTEEDGCVQHWSV